MRLVRLEDDEAGIGIGMFRRKQQIDGADRCAARLQAEKAAKLLSLRIGVQPMQLFGDRIARNLRHSADRDLADFTFAMNVQKLDRTFPPHFSTPLDSRKAAVLAMRATGLAVSDIVSS
jgi:hypothetical protein